MRLTKGRCCDFNGLEAMGFLPKKKYKMACVLTFEIKAFTVCSKFIFRVWILSRKIFKKALRDVPNGLL
jgi:hypothetical protein